MQYRGIPRNGEDMKISFTGHAFICSQDNVKEMVKQLLSSNINSEELITCYLGGYGDFDKICAYACRDLKQEYERVEVVYVAPYIGLREQKKFDEMKRSGFYDAVVYPPIESVPPKFAILKRNEWMMVNADLIIAYVERSYGGAYSALQIAKRKNKKIINVCDFLSK